MATLCQSGDLAKLATLLKTEFNLALDRYLEGCLNLVISRVISRVIKSVIHSNCGVLLGHRPRSIEAFHGYF
jgi:hypothetical protein